MDLIVNQLASGVDMPLDQKLDFWYFFLSINGKLL